jgi:hypothetical protein
MVREFSGRAHLAWDAMERIRSRGTDVIKALALGADFVFVGRPFNYAATVGGHAGGHIAKGLECRLRQGPARNFSASRTQ